MPISPSRFVPYEAKTILIKVYSYENKSITGALHNVILEQDQAFNNLTEMLFGIEQILDDTNFPQSTFEIRSFTPREDIPKTQLLSDDDGTRKPIARFRLNIMFRQNSSWQGNLVWIDENSEVQFRSVLELIRLLDSVLSV